MDQTRSFLSSCPSVDELAELAAGKLVDERASVVERHVATCSACQSQFDAATLQGDSLVAKLRGTSETKSLEPRPANDDSTIGFAVHSEVTPTASPSDLLANRYRLGEFIAAGGMGQVHRAVDVVFNREVAVKRLLPKYEGDQEAGERFRKEAALTAQLQHPGIPPMYDLGVDASGDPFLAMKLIAGRNLAELLKERKSPSEDLQRFLSIFEQIARSVGYAHAQGVIHRDLKPANVMVGEFGEVQVMDWGLAKRLGDNETVRNATAELPDDPHQRTLDGQIMGTLAYMAPEQARGEVSKLGPPADVFALGAILLEILDGGRVYDGKTSGQVLTLAQTGEVITAIDRLKKSGVDEDLVVLTTACLAAQTSDRPADGVAVAERIVAHQATVEARLRESETTRAAGEARAQEQAKRRRLLTYGVAALAAVFAIGTAASTMFAIRAMREARRSNEQTQRAARSLYLAQISRSHSQIKAGEIGPAQASLRSIPLERRGFEHALLTKLAEGTPLTLRRGGGFVTALAFSPDGEALASGSADGELEIWITRTGNRHAASSASGGDRWINSIAFTPNGALIASGHGAPGDDIETTEPGAITLWDSRNAAEVARLMGHESRVESVTFCPAGDFLASGSDDSTVKVWDVKRLSEIATLRGHELGVTEVAFSPDGTRLASGSMDESARVWSTTSWSSLAVIRGHSSSVTAIAFSPDGARLASGSELAIRFWDARSDFAPATSLELDSIVAAIAFSPDGATLATSDMQPVIGGSITLWDTRTSRVFATLKGHEGAVTAMAYSPDGTRLATGSTDGSIKLWDVRPHVEAASSPFGEARVRALAFGQNDDRLAAALGDTLAVVDLRTGAELIRFDAGQNVWDVAFNPTGSRLASRHYPVDGVGAIKIWDARSGKNLASLRHPADSDMEALTGQMIAFSPTDTCIACCGTGERSIRLWDTRSMAPMSARLLHDSGVTSFAFSPDGTQLASGALDFVLRVFDAGTGAEVASVEVPDGVFSIAFSPDGKTLAVGSAANIIELFDAATLVKHETLYGHAGIVQSVAFSPDGRRLASGAADGTAKLWHLQSKVEIMTLCRRSFPVESVAFNHDGTRLAAKFIDGKMETWDTRNAWDLIERTQDSLASRRQEAEPAEAANSLGAFEEVALVRLASAFARRTPHYDDLWSESHDRREYWKPIVYADAAAKAETANDWFAAVWNLKQLDQLKPAMTTDLKRATSDKFATAEAFHADVAARLETARRNWATGQADMAKPESSPSAP